MITDYTDIVKIITTKKNGFNHSSQPDCIMKIRGEERLVSVEPRWLASPSERNYGGPVAMISTTSS
jgi:hypothetical protein